LTAFTASEVAAAWLGAVLDGLVGLAVALLVVGLVEGIATTPTVIKAAISRGRHRRPTSDASVIHGFIAERALAASSTGRAEARHSMSSRSSDERDVPRKPYVAASPRDFGVIGEVAIYPTKNAQQGAGPAVLTPFAATKRSGG
jgi:hypothetical protein